MLPTGINNQATFQLTSLSGFFFVAAARASCSNPLLFKSTVKKNKYEARYYNNVVKTFFFTWIATGNLNLDYRVQTMLESLSALLNRNKIKKSIRSCGGRGFSSPTSCPSLLLPKWLLIKLFFSHTKMTHSLSLSLSPSC